MNIPHFDIIIPARIGSTRLARKPLSDINGKPLIIRVAEQAIKAKADHLWIACDDDEISDVCEKHGFSSILTSKYHQNGTERLHEVLQHFAIPDDRIIVNVQGDEPFLNPEVVHHLVCSLSSSGAGMATIATPILNDHQLHDPSVVKVVCNRFSDALYFTRSPIPYVRDTQHMEYLRHIGLYAYRAGFIRRYLSWPPSALEQTESLEQLRVLWEGERIHICRIDPEQAPQAGIDTPEDLLRVQSYFSRQAL
jgi:3-deoxy-manno-octulosonate cytidylyltransferase (CMP-KDO synthetase)